MRIAAAAAATALLLLVGHGAARALDPARHVSQYAHRFFGIDDGLPQSSVASIAHPRDGYLWVVTEESLARFDGRRFVEVDLAHLGFRSAVGAVGARGDFLIAATRLGGIARKSSRGAFEVVRPETGRRVRGMSMGDDGSVWLVDRVALTRITAEGTLRDYPELPKHRIFDVSSDERRALVATRDAGVLYIEGDRVYPEPLLAGRSVKRVIRARRGGHFVAVEDGLHHLASGRLTKVETDMPALPLTEDRNGGLWVATPSGLGVVRNGRVQVLPDTLPMRPLAIEDSEGSIWAATEVGLHQLRDAPILPLGRPEGLPGAIASAVLEDRSGRIWLGAEKGLARLEGNRIVPLPSRITSPFVHSLAEDERGVLWVGLLGGMARVRDGALEAVPGLEGLRVRSILPMGDGSLLLGTDEGLLRWRPGERAGRSIAGDGVTALERARDGGLWIGTGSGLHYARDGAQREIGLDALRGVHISVVREDERGVVWVGAASGLVRGEGGRFHHFTNAQGVAERVVANLTFGAQGELWVAGNQGIMRYVRSELDEVAAGKRARAVGRPYGRAEGMRSRECNGSFTPSSLRARDGRIFVPTTDGFVAIDPARESANPVAPPVHIEEVTVDGAPRTTRPVVLRGSNVLRVRFAAPSLRGPERTVIRHRLIGREEAYAEASPSREAVFAGLDAGRYRFHVVAANESGVANDEGATLDIEVHKSFPETPWFWLLLAAAATVLGNFIASWRNRLHARRSRELEAVIEARTRELRDAQAELVRAERMASVATLVRGIAHELNNPLQFIAGNVEPLGRYASFLASVATRLSDGAARTREELTELTRLSPRKDLAYVTSDLEKLLADVAEGARRAQLIVRDLQALTTAPSRALVELDLAAAAQQTVRLLAARAGPGVALEVDAEEGLAPVPARAGQLEQCLVNLVDNAMQAVGARGHVTVRVRGDGEFVAVTVADDGPGMSEETRARATEPFFTTKPAGEGSGLGLAIVASIVRGHKGTLELDSAPGKGTRITLRVPRANEAGVS